MYQLLFGKGQWEEMPELQWRASITQLHCRRQEEQWESCPSVPKQKVDSLQEILIGQIKDVLL